MVILSTHIVSVVEATATEIAIIKKGELVTHAAPEKLLAAIQGKVWEWIIASADLPAVKQQFQISGTIRRSDGVQIRVISDSSPNSAANAVTPSLEDAYLYFISGNNAKAEAAV
jgi:ABC-type multidrug transport system ATPase subunit